MKWTIFWLIILFVFSIIKKHDKKVDYQEYLKSNQWKRKRQEVFRYYGKSCCLCGSRENLHVHHRRYDNLGHEPMEDLCVLCSSCHAKYHKHI